MSQPALVLVPPQSPPRAKHLRGDVAQILARLEGPVSRDDADREQVPRATLQGWVARTFALGCLGPEAAAFFESPAGTAWLHTCLLSLIVLWVLGGGGGLRPLRRWVQLVGLNRFVACSVGSLQKLVKQIETATGDFGQEQTLLMGQAAAPRTITALLDETFHFGRTCLVALDAASTFLLLQTYANGRDVAAWNAALEPVLGQVKVTVRQVASDEAKALLSLAEGLLGARYFPDLFHIQHQLSQGFCLPLLSRQRQAQKALEKTQAEVTELEDKKANDEARAVRPVGRPIDWDKRIEGAKQEQQQAKARLDQATADREAMKKGLNAVSVACHPVSLSTGLVRPAEEMGELLLDQVLSFERLAERAGLGKTAFAAVARAIESFARMTGVLTWFWRQIDQKLVEQVADEGLRSLVREVLLPWAYLGLVLGKTSGQEAKAELAAVRDHVKAKLEKTARWVALPEPERKRLEQVVVECATWWQRSSSAVEGQNGVLRLHLHHLHQLRPGRLRALTTLHNFFVRRRDGTTAAERFFGGRHAELLEHLRNVIPLPARPRSIPVAAVA